MVLISSTLVVEELDLLPFLSVDVLVAVVDEVAGVAFGKT